jgi:hypothetical protein
VWLASPDEVAVDDLQPLSTVATALHCERLDQRNLVLACGHDELAASIVRNPMGRAEVVQARRAFDAELRFQRALGVVEAGMDDAAVVRARFHPRAGTTFQDGNRAPGGSESSSNGQAGHAGADNENVERQDFDCSVPLCDGRGASFPTTGSSFCWLTSDAASSRILWV